MIKIFRKIRYDLMEKTNNGKYYKYAIGEIALVVIGILIALQINNWNENRKLKLNENDIISNLIEDLQSDYNNFEINKIGIQKQLKLVDQLIAGIAIPKIDTTIYLHTLRWGGGLYPIAFEEKIPVGIINKNIIENIKIYYRKEKATVEGYEDYGSVIGDLVRPFLRKHGIHNTKTVKEMNYEANNIELLIEEKLAAQYGSEEFEQILFELRLKAGEMLHNLNDLSKANKTLIPILQAYVND